MNLKKFQIGYFGSYSHIKPTSDFSIKITEALKDYNFIPSTIESLEIDSDNGKFINNKRIRMVSEDNAWEIPITPNRIDVMCVKVDEKSLDEIVDYSLKISKILLEILSIKAGRLAFNVYFDIDIDSQEETNNIYKSFIKPLALFDGADFKNWGTKYNQVSSMNFSEDEENINNIFNFDYIKKDDDNKNLKVVLDINTDASKMSERFSYNDIETFSKYAIGKANEICTEIKAVLGNEKK